MNDRERRIARARLLRREGKTYNEIRAVIGPVDDSTLRVWVRGIPRPPETHRTFRRDELQRQCRKLIGVALYWAEGSKSKPYAIRERITFTNSDPTMVVAFVSWLNLLGVELDQCRYRVQIHVTADVQAAEEYWAALVGVPLERFSRATLKRHRPQTNRLNMGDDYRGCLVITVTQSAALYRRRLVE